MSLAYVAMLDYAFKTADRTAAYVTDMARNSLEPVVFVTGNSYLPPARSFSGANEIYWADLDLWDLYWNLVADKLMEASVYIACPDYDNAIYAVDLKRWQYREGNEESVALNEEWEPLTDGH